MINWTRVQELKEEVGPEDFEEVVELFLEEVDETMATLESGLTPDAAEEQMHFLKGSALNLGFEYLGKLCGAGEAAAKGGAFENIDVSAILLCYSTSKAEFTAQL